MDVKQSPPIFQSMPRIEPGPTPIFKKRLSVRTRVKYFVLTWVLKAGIFLGLRILRILRASYFRAIGPTYTKCYPVRPTLENRVFLPKGYVSGTKLPLYIDIHGGGFAICDPATDDHFCHYFANEFGYCVVSINYRKAPLHPFPIPVHDCAGIARAVLADTDLPIDHSKVAVGGFSAGGNLALAVAQMDGLRDKLRAVVPIYPPVDFTSKYRGPFRTTPDGKPDKLEKGSPLFNWSYVSPEIDCRDTLLSSIFANRDQLPQKMYFVGAEYDCLCQEAELLAQKLAGFEQGAKPGSTWNKNGIRWEMVPNQQHGFTHDEASGKVNIEQQKLCRELYGRIDAWLRQEVF